MCWTTKDQKHSESKVAESDIPVFKAVRPQGQPFYNTARGVWPEGRIEPVYTYEAGVTYAALQDRARFLKCDRYCIEKGIHSYSPECQAKNLERGRRRIVTVSEPAGASELDTFYADDVIRMDCVIPEGSVYYLNERGEYVSDMIRVTGFSEFAAE